MFFTEYLKVILTSIFSFITLFAVTKMTGNKQISHLTMFDYVNSITIGSIAAEMATELDKPMLAFTAMIVYSVAIFIISLLNNKSIALRRILFGKSKILFKNGTFYISNFKKSYLDLSEFLMQCRSAGYFDLQDISLAVLEPNGKISFEASASARPLTANDINTAVKPKDPISNIIIDGKILYKNLEAIGKNEKWLKAKLKLNNITNIKDVFLASASKSGKFNFYMSDSKQYKNDFYQ